MKLDRRAFLFGIVAAGVTPSAPAFARSGGARELLEAELASGRPCASEASAIRNTLARMARAKPPRSGRTIVVDMPSQQLSCYEGENVVLTSRVVVGSAEWQTPDLDTTISYIRFNPTWTVPESIIKSRSWRSRLADDPNYFANLNFDVELDGAMVPASQAYHRANEVGRFVQRPGAGNALGLVKLGLNAGNAIYLHDTNDHSTYNDDLRAASHGCVRVEEAIPVAAWVLGVSDDEASWRISDDDRQDYRSFPSPVRFVNTYFTAWPDEFGTVRYYPDIYNRDGHGSAYCSETTWSRPASGGVDAIPSEIIVIGH